MPLNTFRQSAFTLIELISVIVLLGILAAIAAPKFASLSSAARTAAIKDLEGKLISTRTQAKAACEVVPSCANSSFGQVVFLPAFNQNIQVIRNYPDAGEIERADQIDDLITQTGFTLTSENSRTTARWSIPNTTNCYAEYSQAGYLGSLVPLIRTATSGC